MYCKGGIVSLIYGCGGIRAVLTLNIPKMNTSEEDFQPPDFASCSIESLLIIPLQYIFRETQSGKFIFSKSEVSTILRVSMLASEMDAILSLTYDALDRSQKCKSYRKYIEEANKKDGQQYMDSTAISLRALLPIIHVHSKTAEEALAHVTCPSFGITRILNELKDCASDLIRYTEMNYAMADQLDDASSLALDKRAIAEIEEAVVERIEGLCDLTTTSGASKANQKQKEEFIAMADLCESLFPKRQQQQQQQQHIGVAAAAAASSILSPPRHTESQMYAAEALAGLGIGNLK